MNSILLKNRKLKAEINNILHRYRKCSQELKLEIKEKY